MDELDWAHPVMSMPKSKRTNKHSSLGHVSLPIISASPEIFFPSVQQLALHNVVTVAGQHSQLYSQVTF